MPKKKVRRLFENFPPAPPDLIETPETATVKLSDDDDDGEEGEDSDSPPEPHALLQMTANLVEKRYAMVKARRDEHDAQLAAMAPELEEVFWEAYNQARDSHRSAIREEFAAERVKDLQVAFRKRRDRDRPLEERSSAELRAELELAIDEAQRPGDGDVCRRKGETVDAWRARMARLHQHVDGIGFALYVRQRAAKVAYVEGFPGNVLAVHPKFMPPERARRLGVNKCLQCRAKRLRCSNDVVSKRGGERCVVKRKRDAPDKPEEYRFAREGTEKKKKKEGGEGDEEEELKELVQQLWSLRTRDYRVAPIKVWHGNDRPENRTDPDYEVVGWEHVLKGDPTRWRFLATGTRELVSVRRSGEGGGGDDGKRGRKKGDKVKNGDRKNDKDGTNKKDNGNDKDKDKNGNGNGKDKDKNNGNNKDRNTKNKDKNDNSNDNGNDNGNSKNGIKSNPNNTKKDSLCKQNAA